MRIAIKQRGRPVEGFDPFPSGWDSIHPAMPSNWQGLRERVAAAMGVSYWDIGELFQQLSEVRRKVPPQ